MSFVDKVRGYPHTRLPSNGKVAPDGASSMLIRRASVVGSLVAAAAARVRGVADALRHPRSTVRRWRQARRWPRPEDFDRMSPEEFDAYVKRIGFDARIRAALAEPEADDVPADRNRGVPTSAGVP